uniref:Uncharacterized protein n=1 Tax=Arundo donax TaxID=35708 RepID=A0A0A9GU42_ARUDO
MIDIGACSLIGNSMITSKSKECQKTPTRISITHDYKILPEQAKWLLNTENSTISDAFLKRNAQTCRHSTRHQVLTARLLLSHH